MQRSKATLAVIAVLVATLSLPALARGGGRSGGHSVSGARTHSAHSFRGSSHRFFSGPRVGFFLGAPVFAAPYFYPSSPYYYYPPSPPIYVPQTPPAYIERAPSQQLWYFCPEANAYYPQVHQCPGGWQQVPPQPPASVPYSPG